MTKQATKKKTISRSGAKRAKQTETPDIELPPSESVTRHELLGACEFLLVDPGERMAVEARHALFDLQKGSHVLCTMQCAGYVFNITALSFVSFMDRDGNITASSHPKS